MAGKRLRCPACQGSFQAPTFVPVVTNDASKGTGSGGAIPAIMAAGLVDIDNPIRPLRRPRRRVGTITVLAALSSVAMFVAVLYLQSTGGLSTGPMSFLPGMGPAAIYRTPESGPVSITAMSRFGLDGGQKAVVSYLRTSVPDPEKTSFIELRPTGKKDIKNEYFAKTDQAVYGVLRLPNKYGAMTITRIVFYLDDHHRVVDTEDGTMTGPFFISVIRSYYPDEPKSLGEQQNEANIESLTDFANSAPQVGPKRLGKP